MAVRHHGHVPHDVPGDHGRDVDTAVHRRARRGSLGLRWSMWRRSRRDDRNRRSTPPVPGGDYAPCPEAEPECRGRSGQVRWNPPGWSWAVRWRWHRPQNDRRFDGAVFAVALSASPINHRRSAEYPGIDEFDSRFFEVRGVTGGQGGAQVTADGGDLRIGNTDRPALLLPARDDFRVPD
jgi:hypothetical protein